MMRDEEHPIKSWEAEKMRMEWEKTFIENIRLKEEVKMLRAQDELLRLIEDGDKVELQAEVERLSQRVKELEDE